MLTDRYLLEDNTVGYLLEDGSGLLVMESAVSVPSEPAIYPRRQFGHRPRQRFRTSGGFSLFVFIKEMVLSPIPPSLRRKTSVRMKGEQWQMNQLYQS